MTKGQRLWPLAMSQYNTARAAIQHRERAHALGDTAHGAVIRAA